MISFLDVWIWAVWADSSGGPSGECAHHRTLLLCMMEWSERNFRRFSGDLSAGQTCTDGWQGVEMVVRLKLSFQTCFYWTKDVYKLESLFSWWLTQKEALTCTHISHLTVQLHSWVHHKPGNVAVVDGNNWPGMCGIPALFVVCDSQENLFMFSIILASCQAEPDWKESLGDLVRVLSARVYYDLFWENNNPTWWGEIFVPAQMCFPTNTMAAIKKWVSYRSVSHFHVH